MKRLSVFIAALAFSCAAWAATPYYCPNIGGAWVDTCSANSQQGQPCGSNSTSAMNFGLFQDSHGVITGVVIPQSTATCQTTFDVVTGSNFGQNSDFTLKGTARGTPPGGCPAHFTYTPRIKYQSSGCATVETGTSQTSTWTNDLGNSGTTTWSGTCNLPSGSYSSSETTSFNGWIGNTNAVFNVYLNNPNNQTYFDFGGRTVHQFFDHTSYSDTCASGIALPPAEQVDDYVAPGAGDRYTIAYSGTESTLFDTAFIANLVRARGHAPCQRTWTELMSLDCPSGGVNGTVYRKSTITEFINPTTIQFKRIGIDGVTDPDSSTEIKVGIPQGYFGFYYVSLYNY